MWTSLSLHGRSSYRSTRSCRGWREKILASFHGDTLCSHGTVPILGHNYTVTHVLRTYVDMRGDKNGFSVDKIKCIVVV